MNQTSYDTYARKLTEMDSRSKDGDRKKFMEMFRELRTYGYDSDGAIKRMYENFPLQENEFKASINRVAEYVEIFGSHLYPQNPDASVVPQSDADQWKQKRFAVEEKVLDYAMRVGDLETHARRTLNEALIGGRGVIWFGWNSRKGIPQAVFDTVENYSCDPDAKSPEEVNWIRRHRCKPRFEFKKAIEGPLFNLDELKGTGKNADSIEYDVYYLRVGIHNYCQTPEYDTVPEDGGPVEMDDSPKKYTVAEGRLVSVEDWEIPFHQIDAWPCRIIDFRLQPEKLWPVSTLEPGLCHLRAMNWIYTCYINRVKRTSRLMYARVKLKGMSIGDAEVEQAMGIDGSGDAGVIDVELPPQNVDANINSLFQQLKLDSGMEEFDRAWGITNRAWEDSTSLNDLMRSGQDTRQIRTAADVDMKSKRSLTRVDDMKKQVQLFFDSIMYSLAFTARFLMSPEDIAKKFGPDAGQVWGMIAPPEVVEQEKAQRQEMVQMMTMQAQMQQMQAQQMAMEAQAMTPPGMMPPPVPQAPPMPTPEDLEKKIGPPQTVSMDEWINEAARQIVAGSMRTMDHDAQVDNLNMFIATVVPVILPTPGGQEASAAAFNEWVKLNKFSADMQQAMQKYYTTAVTAAMMQQQMAMMPPQPQPSAAKPNEEPSQGREQAVKGQAQ